MYNTNKLLCNHEIHVKWECYIHMYMYQKTKASTHSGRAGLEMMPGPDKKGGSHKYNMIQDSLLKYSLELLNT